MIGPAKLPPRFRTRWRPSTACALMSRRFAFSAAPGPPQPRTYPDFGPRNLSDHWETTPPDPEQLAHAAKFFTRQPPKFLWSAERFVKMSFGDSPEVCFLGRSNVGKSSLLNALLGAKIAYTSSKPGRTSSMNAFGVGREDNLNNRLVVLDMPGYGKGSHAGWGKEIMKYLEKRRELKRTFLLIDTSHGIKDSDFQLLELLNQHSVSHQVILSKVDKIVAPSSKKLPSQEVLERKLEQLSDIMRGVRDVLHNPDTVEEDDLTVGEVIACSSERSVNGKRLGTDAVRFAMLRAAGLEAKPRIKKQQTAPVDIVSHEELFNL